MGHVHFPQIGVPGTGRVGAHRGHATRQCPADPLRWLPAPACEASRVHALDDEGVIR